MEDLWPLFGLRIQSDRVALRLPCESEIFDLARLAAQGVHGPLERPFLTPWAEGSSEERGQFVLKEHWTSLGQWKVDSWQLNLGVFADDQAIGVVSLRARDFPVVREMTSSSWLGVGHHRKGLGTEARRGILALAFNKLNAEAALSEVFQDNEASQGVSRKLGYVHDGLSRDRREDEVATSDRLRLGRDQWTEGAGQAQVSITGFGPCESMFGL